MKNFFLRILFAFVPLVQVAVVLFILLFTIQDTTLFKTTFISLIIFSLIIRQFALDGYLIAALVENSFFPKSSQKMESAWRIGWNKNKNFLGSLTDKEMSQEEKDFMAVSWKYGSTRYALVGNVRPTIVLMGLEQDLNSFQAATHRLMTLYREIDVPYLSHYLERKEMLLYFIFIPILAGLGWIGSGQNQIYAICGGLIAIPLITLFNRFWLWPTVIESDKKALNVLRSSLSPTEKKEQLKNLGYNMKFKLNPQQPT